jgi:hypothetical protein
LAPVSFESFFHANLHAGQENNVKKYYECDGPRSYHVFQAACPANDCAAKKSSCITDRTRERLKYANSDCMYASSAHAFLKHNIFMHPAVAP